MASEDRPTAAGRRRRALEPVDEETLDRSTRLGRAQAASGGSRPTRLGNARQPAAPVAAIDPARARPATAPTWSTPRAPRRRSTARSRPLAGIVTALIAIAVLAYLLTRPDPMHVAGATVAPATDPGSSCDVTVDVVGTVTTDGRAGAFTYRWLRSDGQDSAELTQSVAEGTTSNQVHLLWTVSGPGTYPASATLRVLRPDPVDAVGHFTYSCR
jgi:hypothetical protein